MKTGELVLSVTINTLLLEPWTKFLSFILLRHGRHSDHWKQTSQAVNDIVGTTNFTIQKMTNMQKNALEIYSHRLLRFCPQGLT